MMVQYRTVLNTTSVGGVITSANYLIWLRDLILFFLNSRHGI